MSRLERDASCTAGGADIRSGSIKAAVELSARAETAVITIAPAPTRCSEARVKRETTTWAKNDQRKNNRDLIEASIRAMDVLQPLINDQHKTTD